MATDMHLSQIQAVIGYIFRDPNNLVEALTAAGADEQKYDGNKQMAQLGESIIKAVILDNAFTICATREMANERLCHANSRKNREAIAKRLGISDYVRLNPRQCGQPAPPKVMSLAISAIIGASWRDSNKDFNVVSRIIENIGIAAYEESCINPHMISLDENAQPLANTIGLTAEDGSLTVPFTGSTSIPENPPIECGIAMMAVPATARAGKEEEVRPALQETVNSTNSFVPAQQLAKRQKVSGEKASPRTSVYSGETVLEQLFLEERRKFERLRVSYLRHPFENLLTHICISNMGTDRYRVILKAFFYGVASCESLLYLQEILRSCRENMEKDLPTPTESLSEQSRLQVIERLDGKIAYLSFLKRCHVLNLILDKDGSCRQVNGGFVVQTQESFPEKPTSGFGNPLHKADAMITKSIANQVYPQLRDDTADHERKYRRVYDLRRLGRHLLLLTDTFGLGILGLLPPTTSSVENPLYVSDSMLSTLPTDVFYKLVMFLDKYQGSIIRQFSSVLTPVVDSIVRGTFPHHSVLPIEQVEQRQITEEPKGAPMLLKLLSHNSVLQEVG